MFVFDRVLDGDDVPGVALVDLVDDRRERAGFAGAGDTGDEDETSGNPRDPVDLRGRLSERIVGGLVGRARIVAAARPRSR
jgi:hypothetical protein